MMRKLNAFLRDNQGIAAIEMAFILPLLLFLYFGLFDITAMISLNRKITYSASVVADLVTQKQSTIASTEMDDFFNAAALVLKPTPVSGVRIEVYQYRKVSNAVTNQWSKKSTGGTACGAPATTGFNNLMTDGNDLIVAVVCTTYKPYMASFLGDYILGSATFNMSEQIALRPRSSSTLDCTGCS
ncbi:TadE/TadG family type IV pilus assembly protein [Aestuariivirga sp.]|uniref:TadE/TadG family type IV pilus assembly protein n=1 Tax=Aestuariivirga sp. TaxID=2650926 RepID=UPI0039E3480F